MLIWLTFWRDFFYAWYGFTFVCEGCWMPPKEKKKLGAPTEKTKELLGLYGGGI